MHKSLKSFFLAWVVIVVSAIVFIFTVRVAVSLYPSQVKNQPKKEIKAKLPSDIPLYEGAYLSKKYEATSDHSEWIVHQYLVPVSSVSKVRMFYEGKMQSEGWQLYIDSDSTLDYYKENGDRRVKVTFLTESGRVLLTIEMSKNTP